MADYSALIQQYESEAPLDCGCVLRREPDNDREVSITFCRLHEAASKLLRALEMQISDEARRAHDDAVDDEHDAPACPLCMARAAMAAAQ